MIKALLVDDERLANKRLASLLSGYPGIQIVGEAEDVESAARLASELRPNVVFLDIQMPPVDGFQLIPLLPLGTIVVFVTAFDQYAVRAFETAALDYLLKPVAPERLAQTLQRLGTQPGKSGNTEVLLGDSRNWIRVPTREIAAILAEGSYTLVLCGTSGSHLVKRSMQEWLNLLPSKQFLRASRSLMVNRDRILGIRSRSRDDGDLMMKDRIDSIPLGRTALKALRGSIRVS